MGIHKLWQRRTAGWLAVRSIKEYLASSLCACRGGIRRSFASCVILLFLPSPSSSNGFTSLLDSAQRRAAQYAVDITMLFISPMKASGRERERDRGSTAGRRNTRCRLGIAFLGDATQDADQESFLGANCDALFLYLTKARQLTWYMIARWNEGAASVEFVLVALCLLCFGSGLRRACRRE